MFFLIISESFGDRAANYLKTLTQGRIAFLWNLKELTQNKRVKWCLPGAAGLGERERCLSVQIRIV